MPADEPTFTARYVVIGIGIAAALFAAMFFVGRATGGSGTKTRVVHVGGAAPAVVVSTPAAPKLVSISTAGSIPNLVTPPPASSPSSSSGGGTSTPPSSSGGGGGGGGSSGGSSGSSGGSGGG